MKIRENNGEKVLVAMDFRNVNKPLCEAAGNARKDYSALLDAVINGRECVAAFAYDSLIRDGVHDTCQHTHDMLREAGFTVRMSEAPSRNDKQGHVDVFMALDVYRYVVSNHIDVVELITGDSDFIPLMKMLQDLGVRVRISSFRKTLAPIYQTYADDIRYLDSVPMIEMEPVMISVEDDVSEGDVSLGEEATV